MSQLPESASNADSFDETNAAESDEANAAASDETYPAASGNAVAGGSAHANAAEWIQASAAEADAQNASDARADVGPAALAWRSELCQAWRSLRYAQGYQRLHPLARTASLPVAGGYGIFIAPGSPLNNARGVGLSGPVTAADLQALEDFYIQRGESLRLHVCPLVDPSLLALVRQRGYRLRMFFSVLTRPIPADFQPAPLPAGLRVTRAGLQDAEQWLRLSAQGFEAVETPSPETLEILSPNFHAPDSAALLAWIEDVPSGRGVPAGTGGVYFAPQVGALEPAPCRASDGAACSARWSKLAWPSDRRWAATWR